MLKTISISRYKLSAESTLDIRNEIHTQNCRVFSFVGYATPVEQTEGTREFKEEGDCLQLTIDRQSPSVLLTVSFLSCRLDEEG